MARSGPKPVGKELRDQRRRDIEQMLSLQVPHAMIADRVTEQYSVSARQIYYDIRSVYKRMEEEGRREKPMRRQVMRRSLRDFYQRAMKAGHYGAALGALDRLIKLDGLAEATRIEVNSNVSVEHRLRNMTSDEKRKRIDELFSMYSEADSEADSKGNGHSVN